MEVLTTDDAPADMFKWMHENKSKQEIHEWLEIMTDMVCAHMNYMHDIPEEEWTEDDHFMLNTINAFLYALGGYKSYTDNSRIN